MPQEDIDPPLKAAFARLRSLYPFPPLPPMREGASDPLPRRRPGEGRGGGSPGKSGEEPNLLLALDGHVRANSGAIGFAVLRQKML